MASTRVLITGASGFIGGELFQAFQQRGWDSFGLGRRACSQPRYWSLDLSKHPLSPLVRELRTVDVVVHAAARSSPWGNKSDFERANILGTQSAIELAYKLKAQTFLFLSSSSVYYAPYDQLSILESTPFAKPAVNLYAESKQRGEELVRRFAGRWCILRPRAVYGVGDTVLFPRILKAAQAGKLPWLIRTGSPAVGDLLSVQNLVEVCLRAAADSSIQGDYNITDNSPVEILPFLASLLDRLGIPQPKRRISTNAAFRLAWCIEKLYALFMPHREPPITRFGVHVFAYSKTFDVSKMLRDFGPPSLTVDSAVHQFVQWVQSDADPYQLQR